jgi:hypothetical protein
MPYTVSAGRETAPRRRSASRTILPSDGQMRTYRVRLVATVKPNGVCLTPLAGGTLGTA